MEIVFIGSEPRLMAEIITEQVCINTQQDALDVMANCSYQGASGIIFYEHQLNSDFFDLKTKLAGDILQKFSNYRCRLVIVGDFEKYKSKALRDFIGESNRGNLVKFAPNREEAISFLS
jgi:GTPase SAR1 family protein